MTTDDMPINLLPEIYQDLAETVGLDAALALGREFGGMNIYLPKVESALRSWRDINIRREFTGANVSQLARKYHLTQARVRQILESGREK